MTPTPQFQVSGPGIFATMMVVLSVTGGLRGTPNSLQHPYPPSTVCGSLHSLDVMPAAQPFALAHLHKRFLALPGFSVAKGHLKGGQAARLSAAARPAAELPLPAQHLRLCAPAQPQLVLLRGKNTWHCHRGAEVASRAGPVQSLSHGPAS